MKPQKRENDHFRWWVLSITAMGMFAYGYAYDNVGALSRQLVDTYNLSNVQYNLLYSIWTLPNIIVPTITGILADKYGYNFFIIFFFGLMVLGQATYIIGCYLNATSYSYFIMLMGRLILGIGAESHMLVVAPFIYDYFKGKELAFAYAFRLSISCAGSSLNHVCTYFAYKHFNGTETMKIVFASAIALVLLLIFWVCIIVLIMFHKERETKKTPKSTHDIQQELQQEVESTAPSSKMKMSDIMELSSIFWLLTWNCGIMYAIATAWMNVGGDYLQSTYSYSHGKANVALSIPYSLAAILQPIWGMITDKYGKRTQLLFAACVLYSCAHYIFGWIRFDGHPLYIPILGLILLGCGYSVLNAVVWSCFPLIVPERTLATAYGIATSGYNLISTVFYVIVGHLTSDIDHEHKYVNVQYFLLIAALSSVVTSFWLIYQDQKTGLRLIVPNYENAEAVADRSFIT